MLNEQIERCKFIGDLNGILFFIDAINSGVRTRASLFKLYSHNIGSAKIEIDVALLLFNSLELIQYDGYHIENNSVLDLDREQSIIQFSDILSNALIDNGILNLDLIKYDSKTNEYYLPFNSFLRKHAIYRNLLLTLNIIKHRSDSNFCISKNLALFIKKSKHRKITQEKLLKILELQQIQGEKGELFVVKFEQQRLDGHNQIEDIQRISQLDASAGYDIISFNSTDSDFLDRFIEVKTYSGYPHFHWSINEVNTSRLYGNNYYLYLVDASKIDDSDYIPIIIQDPASYFENNPNWLSKAESYYIELLNDII